jgi:group I intron endonuclease
MSCAGSIYRITNNLSGKVYIGQTTRLPLKRFRAHTWGKGARAESMPIRLAIKKYGKQNFTFEVIFVCFHRDFLDEMESFFIKSNNSISPNGYNLESGGHANKSPSKETLEKLRQYQRKHNGKPVTCRNLLTGEEISVQCMSDVRELGFTQSEVSSVCSHKKYSHRGWTFKFSDSEYPDLNKK